MRTAIITILIMLLAGCKFHYRYPCQDPANWDKEWCSNDVCKADGTCTEKLIGFPPKPNQKISPEDLANTDGNENLPEARKDISTDKPADKPANCKTTVIYKELPIVSKGEKIAEPKVEQIVDEPPREMPLTMTTVVDTGIHNRAAKN
jgi:hypothetical protein